MIQALERFVVELRREGLPASPAEWLDALRAVEAVGVDDRERLRDALRCTLVKRLASVPTFDRVFERTFAAPARGGRGRRGATGRAADGLPSSSDGGAPAAARSAAAPRSPDVARPDRRRMERRSARRVDGDGATLARSVERLSESRPPAWGRLRHVERGAGGAPAFDPRAPRRAAGPDDRERVDLRGRLGVEDERALAEAVPRVVERLRLRRARRTRRSAHGRPAWRRVFRANAGTGGVPFVVPRRRRRRRRAQVVLAIDVSWSTARAAGLFLAVAGAFLAARRELGRVRVAVFVDRMIDATRPVLDWVAMHPGRPARGRRGRPAPGAGIERGGVSFAELVEGLSGLDVTAPSDYGRAFHDLLSSPRRPRGRGTVLLVLGDGRTNRFDPQGWAFGELAAGCGAVLWLVPEPVGAWSTGDSALGSYLPACDVAVEARDLAGLERGVAALARRL